DTIDSVGYIIEDTDHKLVYITDTGYIRNEDLNLLLDADIIVLESNHDPKMLMDSKRPYYIKQRILSDTGHLSNDKAGTILAQIVSDNTQEVVLAHLSDEANTEELAFDTVSRYLNGFKGRLKVGKQHEVVSGKIKG
ncbi:MAG TPA: MBL fold metallo-hydrolase, partial [Erysipelothrix sp.]|nr:MBL fold metallo-hydrolase [Erysipelothrix sp.]